MPRLPAGLVPRLPVGRLTRLPPEQWYPAGVPGVTSRQVVTGTGLAVRVVETGPPDGAPVLLLHGWACSVYSFRHQLPALAAAGLRAIAVDLKGHGLTDKPTGPQEYTREAMTAFAAGVADALGLERFALVGHSLGGGIATRFTLEHPERVARLAVISAVGFGRVPFIPLVRVLPAAAVEPLLPYLMPRWLYRLVLWGVTGNLRQYSERDVSENWAPTQFPEFPVALWRLVREYGWAELGHTERQRLAMPLLAIYGSGDRVVRHAHGTSRARWGEAAGGGDAADDAAATGERVAGAAAAMADVGLHTESHIIRGAGHAAHEEAPAAVSRLLVEFLAPWAAEHPREEPAREPRRSVTPPGGAA